MRVLECASTGVWARHVAPVVHGGAVRRRAARRQRQRRVRRLRALGAAPRGHRVQAGGRGHVLALAAAQRAHVRARGAARAAARAPRARAGAGRRAACGPHVPAPPRPAPPAPLTYTEHTRITTAAHIASSERRFRAVFTHDHQSFCTSYKGEQ